MTIKVNFGISKHILFFTQKHHEKQPHFYYDANHHDHDYDQWGGLVR
ncbi:hypothetical protein ANH9381_1859 [Aggregatibacter actinomycetemcomitans ANH9381]|nr:hypothetical protein ANH9381_1859 [Aggregatibacter actinomycetemcomitans ANH9381]